MGYGTYVLDVKLTTSERRRFNAIDIPSISSSYRFWVNGSVVRSAGTLGTSRALQVAADRPGLAVLGGAPADLHIVVEVSNFVQQKGGIGEPILLGNVNDLTRLHYLRLFLQLFIVGSLFIIGVYHITFYLQRPSNKFSLYFALLCFDVSTQTLVLNSSNLVTLLPHIGWIFESKAVYFSESVLITLFVLVIGTLYPDDMNQKVSNFLVTIGLLFSALFVLTPPWIFTYTITYISLFAGLAMIYSFYVFIRAIKKKRENAWLQVLSLSFFVATGLNDILYYLNIIKTGNLLPEGLYAFVLVQNLAASQKHAGALSDLENRTEELLVVNNDLENRIQDRTKELERTMEQLRQTNQQLTELSTHDTLTTIFNRSYFDRTMPDVWKELVDSSGFVTLMLADIDYFKEYNDTYGHLMGDACLREVAVTIENCLQPYDGAFIARYGGEEFVIVLPNIHPRLAVDMANRLREEVLFLNIPHSTSRADSVVSVSIGLTGANAVVVSQWQELVATADRALYVAKEQGRNRVELQD